MVNYPPKSTARDEKVRMAQKNLHEAQSWRSRLGYFPSRLVPSSGGNTNDDEGIEPGITLQVSPRLFAWRTCRPARVKNIRIERRNRAGAAVIHLAELPRRAGIKTGERDTFKPNVVVGASPPLFVRRHCTVQAERRPSVAT